MTMKIARGAAAIAAAGCLAMPAAAQAGALCVACFREPLLKLMAIGSSKGSDGLWLF